jgi:dTDP-4-amino-4,6-dideoxygalactose transaminase
VLNISRPHIGRAEINRVTKVLKSGLLAQGSEVAKLEAMFADYCGCEYAVAFNSGTAALHAGLQALGIQEGDEVIVPAFTFVATASPVLMLGARVIFADIAEDDFCLDPKAVEKMITSQTKAIIPVDLYGALHKTEDLEKLALRHDLAILEDACQAIGAESRGRKAGSFGKAATFSLYATKNITCGEGGVLTTNDPIIVEKARMFRHHGQREQYEYLSLGYNYRMTDIQAAIAIEQLKKVNGFNERRIANAERLTAGLRGIPGLVVPTVKIGGRHVFHQYTIRITDDFKSDRLSFAHYLQTKGIATRVFYPLPLHLSKLFSNDGYARGDFPVSEKMAEQALSLPVHPLLTKSDIERIITTIRDYAE